MRETVKTGLGNYYGSIEARKVGDKFYLVLENYDGYYGVEISEQLFNELEREFSDNSKTIVYLDGEPT